MDSNVNEVITDEMVKEENRLHEAGMQQEKEEMDREEKLLKELTDQSREQRYERLKYLLDKSTMYTEYLVSRIKKQKEEEEKRKKRILNAKIRNATNITENGSAGKPEGHSSQRRTGLKRKAREEQDKPSPTQKSKHLKKDTGSKSHSQTAKLQTEDNENCDGNVMTKKTEKGQVLEDTTCGVSQIIDQEPNCGAESDCPEDEPELIEKATTFGIGEESEGERIINGEEVPFLQPHLMDGGVLRPYQVEGFSWLKVLYENGVNGILADEMGLGKTVQCVAVLSHLVYMGIPGPYLICAPLSTIPNWFSEFQRFAPKIPTVLYHGNKESRAHLSKRIHKKHKIREGVYVQPVVITSYEIAMIDKRFLASHEWKYLIVDEGHRIKNTHCRLVRDLQMYKSTHRLLLTGTPLQNNLAELWSLLNFLLPEIFDDLGSFESWFDVKCMNDIDSENKIIQQERTNSVLSMLHQILSPFMLRRLKSDVDLDIPPKKEILVFAPLTQQQKDFYSALVDRTILSMLDKKNETAQTEEVSANGRPKRRSVSKKIDYSMLMETKKEQQENKKTGKERAKRWRNDEDDELELEQWVEALNDMRGAKVKKEKEEKTSMVTIKMRNVMMQLRKCCNHPFLLEHPVDPVTGELTLSEDVITTSGKMLVLDQMLAQLKKRGHRVLIFSQMTRMLDLMEDFCVIRGYNFCRLDGSTSVDDRRDSMSIFNGNTSDKFLFLLSTRAGGLGINLTGADTVIIYDSDWNPQCDLQAQDRCHRIGQNKPVVVYRFVTANTIDQKIIERAAAKRKLEKMVIHKGNFKSGNFKTKAKPITPEELQALLQSKDHDTVVTGGDFIISKTEMNALLDRKDLYEKWEQNSKKSQEEDEKASNKSVSPSATPNKRQSKAEKQSHLFKVMDVEEQQVMSITNESPKTEVMDH